MIFFTTYHLARLIYTGAVMYLSELSYKEKSIWVSLALTLYLIYYYSAGLFSLSNTGLISEGAFTQLLTDTILWLTTLFIISHIVISALNAKEANQPDDERDKTIEMLSTRNAYYILVFGIIISVVQTQFNHFEQAGLFFKQLSSVHNIMHYIFISFIAAETVKYISQLYYYRRGF